MSTSPTRAPQRSSVTAHTRSMGGEEGRSGMAQHEHIDLTTLREVERLLASTEFVTADELLARGAVDVSTVRPATTPSAPTASGSSLPRRR